MNSTIKKKIYIFFLISIFLSLLFTINHYHSIYKLEKINVKDIKEINLKSENEKFPYYIDKIEKYGKKIFIEGWIVKKGEDNFYINRVIVLRDSQGNYYKLFTKSTIRREVSTWFKNEYNYDRTGLISIIKINKTIKYPLNIYFLVQDNDEKILINTNHKIEGENK